MNAPVITHFIETFSRLSETFLYLQPVAQRRIGMDARVLAHERIEPGTRPFAPVDTVPRPRLLSPSTVETAVRRAFLRDPVWNRSTRRLSRALGRQGSDLLHVHYGWSGPYLLRAARRAGLPMICSFYGRDATLDTPERVRPRMRELLARAHRILVLSQRMEERLLELGADPRRLQVHHLAVDTSALRYREPAPVEGTPTLVSVGRLVPKKGMDVLIRAAGILASQGTDVRVRIVGGGPEAERLRALSAEQPAGTRIEFLGARPHEETLGLLAAADLFVLASRTAPNGDAEGTPTVLLEAQALGRPLVSTLHEGIPECLPPENRGWLVPEGDAPALASALERLLSVPDQWPQMTARGRAWVEREFDALRQAERAREIYRELLDGR